MKIFLVRHGESFGNIDKNIHLELPDHAIGLSDRGKEQSKCAGKKIEDYLITHNIPIVPMFRLWTSPYRRTRETADEIQKNVNIIIDRKEHILLCEQQFGLFDGIPDDELPKLFPNEYAFYEKCKKFGGKFWARMPLGESRFDVATRIHQSFGTFLRDRDKYNIHNIIVVCHGVTLRAFVMMWCHFTPEWFESEPNPLNGAVRLIDEGKDKGYI